MKHLTDYVLVTMICLIGLSTVSCDKADVSIHITDKEEFDGNKEFSIILSKALATKEALRVFQINSGFVYMLILPRYE